ncbi:UNVERIFIED_CONTAM: hypothetical protein LBW93_03705 [Wolbachia endosymbiont of Nasonia longicornis]
MNDKFSLRDYPLKAASLYVSALSFILENTIVCDIGVQLNLHGFQCQLLE